MIPEAMQPAHAEAVRQLAAVMAEPDGPFSRDPKPGHRRGIDAYKSTNLIRALTNAMFGYHDRFGIYPDMVAPKTFNEKIFRFKFFGNIKVPETGNKLLTERFIPEALRDRLRCPPLIWHSDSLPLPRNDRIAPGRYYLKANHGSGLFKAIRYPLDDAERPALAARAQQWLGQIYGIHDGEWWYAGIPRRLMLEADVCDGQPSVSWNVYVMNGRIGCIELFDKNAEPMQVTWLDADFRPDSLQMDALVRVKDPVLPADPEFMKQAALAIAAPYDFARVDFFVGADGTLYLGEITFSPSNALSRRPAAMEQRLGALLRFDPA